MTKLKRVLTLLERYDSLAAAAAAGVGSHDSEFGRLLLKELREEKEIGHNKIIALAVGELR